jgi:hypothetical protein
MNKGEISKKFLACIGRETKAEILQNIAATYGISQQQAFEEVTCEEAESLLDYVTGPQRSATSVLMQKFKFN